MALIRCDDLNAIILVIRKSVHQVSSVLGVEIDPDSVDYIASAAKAMEGEISFEGNDCDADDEHKQAIRFVLSAVDFCGVPIVDELILEMLENKDRCSFTGFSEQDLSKIGREQIVHNSAMVVSPKQLKKDYTYFRFVDEKPASLLVVVEVKNRSLVFYDPLDIFKLRQELSLSSVGIMPYPNGTWNVWNWLEEAYLSTEIE